MRIHSVFFVAVAVLVIAGCSLPAVREKAGAVGVVSHPAMDAGLYEGPAVVVHKGTPVFSWYDPKRRLMADFGGGPKWVSEGAPAPSLLSHNFLHSDGHSVYFVFRPKGEAVGWKYTIVRASHDDGKTLSEPVIINHGNGAMEPAISSSGKGDVYVAWNDERDGPLDIYMNISHDFGKTWLEQELRMNTENEPGTVGATGQQIFVDGERVWIVWIDVAKEDKPRRLMIRSSNDSGRSWTGPGVLAENENFYDPKIMMVKGRMVIIWCSISPANKFVHMAKGIVSDDLGKTWEPMGEIKVRSWMQFEINASSDKSGNIYLALAVRDKYKTGLDNVYFTMSADGGKAWSEPARLQTNTPHHTAANLPQIASDDSGRVFVAWVDYRNIRGNVYANYSGDRGRTWLKEDMLLSRSDHNASLPRVASSGSGRFPVVWLESNDDGMAEGVVRMKEVEAR